ncbi:MAG TPA: PAS domain S-box protein [Pseudonocardiaceae bacterium]
MNIAYASEDRFRTLLDNAPEAILVLDVKAGSFWHVNCRAVTLFGLPREQLERLGPGPLSPPRQPDGRPSDEAVQEMVAQAVAGRKPVFRWTYRAGDGHDLPCEVRLVRLPDADRVLVRASITEVGKHSTRAWAESGGERTPGS